MKRFVAVTLLAAGAGVLACSSESSGPNASALLLSAASAYTTVPSGFSNLNTSFDASDGDAPFMPSFDGRGPLGPGGRFTFGHGAGFGIGFMGGLGGPFLGFGIGEFFHDDSCAFSSSTGLVTCSNQLKNGLTISRTFKYTDSKGNAQSKIDTTTNTVMSSVTVTGSVSRHDGAQTTVNESSAQTVAGIAKGSTQRTVDGKSAGTETTTGTDSLGTFTAKRVAGDTISGVVIPVGTSATTHPPFPTAGTIIRSMSVTITVTGQSPATSSRREMITYDGSTTAKVVITEDGNTQNCTLPLPFGRLSCQ